MKQNLKNHVALIALGLALSGCSSFSLPSLSGGADEAGETMRPVETPKSAGQGLATDIGAALDLAQTQRKQGALDAATRTISQLLLVAPDDSRIVGEYGKILLAKGQPADALAFFTRALELQADEWSVYSAQGVAYDQLGNYSAAQKAYARALSLNPTEPSVLSNAALSQMQAGNLPEAEILLLRAKEHGGDNQRILQNLAYLQSLKEKQPDIAAASPVAAPQPSEEAKVVTVPPPAPVEEAGIAEPMPHAPQFEPNPEEVAGTAPENGPDAVPTEAATAALPVEPAVAATTEEQQKEPLTGAAALAADPTVVMQALPKPDPVPVKQPVRKAVAAKPAPQRQATATDDGLRRLRPAQ
jgi:Flp pilus assembly protein TadD